MSKRKTASAPVSEPAPCRMPIDSARLTLAERYVSNGNVSLELNAVCECIIKLALIDGIAP